MAKHDWKSYEKRFLAKEWLTLVEMAEKTGVSISMIRKTAAKFDWHDKRLKLELAGMVKAEEIIIQTHAEELVAMSKRHKQVAKLLQGKALRLLGKEGHEFAREDTALRALQMGLALELQVLMKNSKGDDPDGGAAPAMPADGPQLPQKAFKSELTREDLLEGIRQLREMRTVDEKPTKKVKP